MVSSKLVIQSKAYIRAKLGHHCKHKGLNKYYYIYIMDAIDRNTNWNILEYPKITPYLTILEISTLNK